MKSKEKILEQFCEGFTGYEISCISRAMDEHTKQKAIGFAEWLKETNWGEHLWSKHDPPSYPTIPQLYQTYLTNSKPKEQ